MNKALISCAVTAQMICTFVFFFVVVVVVVFLHRQKSGFLMTRLIKYM